MKSSARGRVAALLLVLLVPVLFAGCSQQQQSQANATAVSSTRTSIEPLLTEVAQRHPEQANAVNQALSSWGVPNERATFNQVQPLLAIERADNPTLAPAIDNKIATWDARLKANGQ